VGRASSWREELAAMKWLRRVIGGVDRAEPQGTAGIDELAARLGMSAAQLRGFGPEYREFDVPKRGGGMRRIAAPDRGTRDLQRLIARRILPLSRLHPDAMGFRRGRSMVDHARRHSGKAVVLRMDLKDFFGSTRADRVRRYFRGVWDQDAADVLTSLTTYRGALPQGAPTSPGLSNLLNRRLDARMAGFAAHHGVTYSRYADDITFSLDSDDAALVRMLIRFTKKVVRESGYELHLRRKLHVRRQHQRQLVGGLIVNAVPRLPRERRRWLRAVEHRVATGSAPTVSERQLAGWRAYRAMVERVPPSG
jgi:RNA-directed DNA polymerase